MNESCTRDFPEQVHSLWYAGDCDEMSESLRQLTTNFLEVETDPDTHPLLPSPASALCEFLLCLNKTKYVPVRNLFINILLVDIGLV